MHSVSTDSRLSIHLFLLPSVLRKNKYFGEDLGWSYFVEIRGVEWTLFAPCGDTAALLLATHPRALAAIQPTAVSSDVH